MSILHIDGFDLYGSASDLNTTYSSAGCNFSTTAGRFGGGAMQIGSYNQALGYTLPSAQTEIWVGFALYSTSGANQPVIGFRSASGTEAGVWYDAPSGTFIAHRGAGGTTLGSGVKNVNSAWHWLEFHFKLDGSAGVIEVWVDGVQVVNATGQNTLGAGGSTVSAVIIGSDLSNNATNGYYDDLYILSTAGSGHTTRLGDSKVETLSPTSDAGPNNGTSSSGSNHYAMVNDAHMDGSSSTIDLAGTSGQEELFGIGSLASTPATVHAVKVTNIVQKTDAGVISGEGVIVSSGTEADGVATPLTTSFSMLPAIFEQDPNTAAAWTYGGVNAAKIGFKVA